jgi:hypothetical protein
VHLREYRRHSKKTKEAGFYTLRIKIFGKPIAKIYKKHDQRGKNNKKSVRIN